MSSSSTTVAGWKRGPLIAGAAVVAVGSAAAVYLLLFSKREKKERKASNRTQQEGSAGTEAAAAKTEATAPHVEKQVVKPQLLKLRTLEELLHTSESARAALVTLPKSSETTKEGTPAQLAILLQTYQDEVGILLAETEKARGVRPSELDWEEESAASSALMSEIVNNATTGSSSAETMLTTLREKAAAAAQAENAATQWKVPFNHPKVRSYYRYLEGTVSGLTLKKMLSSSSNRSSYAVAEASCLTQDDLDQLVDSCLNVVVGWKELVPKLLAATTTDDKDDDDEGGKKKRMADSLKESLDFMKKLVQGTTAGPGIVWLIAKSTLLGDLPSVGNGSTGNRSVADRKRAAFQLLVLSLNGFNELWAKQSINAATTPTTPTTLAEVITKMVQEDVTRSWDERGPRSCIPGLTAMAGGVPPTTATATPISFYLAEIYFSLASLVSTLEIQDLNDYILKSPTELKVSSLLDRNQSKAESIEEHLAIMTLTYSCGNHGRAWMSLANQLAVRETGPMKVTLFGREFSELDCYVEALRCSGGVMPEGDGSSISGSLKSAHSYEGDAWTNLALSLEESSVGGDSGGGVDSVPIPRHGGVSFTHSLSQTSGGGGDIDTNEKSLRDFIPVVACDRKTCLAKALSLSEESHQSPEMWIELAKCLTINFNAEIVEVPSKTPTASPGGTATDDPNESSRRSTSSENLEGLSSTRRRNSSIRGPSSRAVLYRVQEERVQVGSPESENRKSTIGYTRIGCLMLAIALDVQNYEAWYQFALCIEDETRARESARKAALSTEMQDVLEEVEVVLDPSVYRRTVNVAGSGNEEEEPITLTRSECLAWCISVNPKNPKAWFALGSTLAERDVLLTQFPGGVNSSTTSTTTTGGGGQSSEPSTQAVDPKLGVGTEEGIVTYKDCFMKCRACSPRFAKVIDQWLEKHGLSL